MPLLLLCHDNTRCLCLCTSQLNFLLSTRSYQMKIREKYTIGMVKTDWRNVEAEIMTLSLGKIVELCNKKQCNVTQIYNHAWWHMHSFIYSIRSSLTSIQFFCSNFIDFIFGGGKGPSPSMAICFDLNKWYRVTFVSIEYPFRSYCVKSWMAVAGPLHKITKFIVCLDHHKISNRFWAIYTKKKQFCSRSKIPKINILALFELT